MTNPESKKSVIEVREDLLERYPDVLTPEVSKSPGQFGLPAINPGNGETGVDPLTDITIDWNGLPVYDQELFDRRVELQNPRLAKARFSGDGPFLCP